MTGPRMPSEIYFTRGATVHFNQLAIKVAVDSVTNSAYFDWLDDISKRVGYVVPGASIVEKEHGRVDPPINTAVYYDTDAYDILPTGALLRTSCNKVTHAFCAFKAPQDDHNVRDDHRYVFEGLEKRAIQDDPTSDDAVAIVKRLLCREDILHPGIHLRDRLSIEPTALQPALALEDYRYTFYAWIGGKDALRCSLDRFETWDLRRPVEERRREPVSEVEIAVYPRIAREVAEDRRVVDLMLTLKDSLCERFGVTETGAIKYQRSAAALEITGGG